MGHAIEVEDLTKQFNGFTAVDHIDLQVHEGEIFGFLGPNGAGKTTTIRILTGVIKPTGGTAKILGYDIQKESLRAKQLMGTSPEMANAYVDLSAWQNLMFVGELYGVGKQQRERTAEQMLKHFDLYERRHQKLRKFSRGMMQRVIVAMSLMSRPRILFLDEPTSGLDVESSRTIHNLVRRFSKEGKTVFLTTHNIEEASQLCDRVAIINKGRIAAIDTPEKLKRTIRGVQSVEVSFDRYVDIENELGLTGVHRIERRGDKFRLYTEVPGKVACELADYAKKAKLDIVTINTLGPSLEDVFLELTREAERK